MAHLHQEEAATPGPGMPASSSVKEEPQEEPQEESAVLASTWDPDAQPRHRIAKLINVKTEDISDSDEQVSCYLFFFNSKLDGKFKVAVANVGCCA